MKTLTIDIVSDVVCPWCFIGTRRLRAVVDELADEVQVTLRHHPFLLNPGAPPEGIDLHAQLAERYGTDPRPMFARVEEAALEAGISLDLSAQRYSYDTTAAHTLLRHAEAKGTQDALADALFRAYFLDALNIADPEVLARVAEPYGFDADEARRAALDENEAALTRLEAMDAARSGVRGVPHFVLDGHLALSGAQPPEVFREAIRRAIAAEARESAA